MAGKNNRKKKRHTGLLIFSVLLAVTAGALFLGRDQIASGVKHQAAKALTKELLKSQIGSSVSVGGKNVDVSELIENMEPEDVEKAADIAEKYISEESVGEALDMVKSGDITGLRSYAEENISQEDKQKLMELYEKYKDQIPVN